MKFLSYEKLVLKECSSEPHLLIMAEGLNLPKMVITLASLYDYPDTLCLVINSNDKFDTLFSNESFTSLKTNSTLKRIENYKIGGVKICQAQALISDLLNKSLDVKLISAIFVVNAEEVRENSITAFILHYIALNSSNTVIKAFTEDAIKVSKRHFYLDDFLGVLKLRNVVLFPRFQKDVSEELNTSSEFVEVKMKMSGWLEEIQLYLMDLIQSVTNEKEKYNKKRISFNEYYTSKEVHATGSDDKKTTEHSIPVNVLNNISQTLQRDLSNLKRSLDLLFTLDLNYFIAFFTEIYNQEIANRGRTWILNTASHMVMEVIEKIKTEKNVPNWSSTSVKNHDEYDMKNAYGAVDVKRMKLEDKKGSNDDCKESNTRLEEIDTVTGSKTVGIETAKQVHSDDCATFPVTMSKDRCVLKTDSRKRSGLDLKNKKLVELNKILSKHPEENVLIVSRHDHNKEVVSSQDVGNRIKFVKHNDLDIIQQNIVVLVDFNLGTFRKIERMRRKMLIYFLYYKESYEEEQYVRRIREEKEAFERFVNEKAKLGLQDFNFFIDVEDEQFDVEEEDTCSSKSKYNVLVDFRELRASLPFFLYKAKNNVRVVCLEEGDYLFDNFVVERKTIYDLIMSLNNGRLLSQMTRLSSNHSNYYLLVEYESQLSLAAYSNRNEIFRNSLISKFVLLAIKFTKLRFIYTNNDILSAKLLRCLQRKEMGKERVNQLTIDPYMLELLLSIPGVNSFCIRRIQQNFNNLKEMICSSEEKLVQVLGNERGKVAFNFFNK